MWHLAMETIGLAGSVALFQGGELVERVSLATGSGSARNLLPAIDRLLGGQKLRSGELGLVSLAHGPGSFTGLRVGVSTAKAFGFALRVPVVAVDTLEALMHSLARQAVEKGLIQTGIAHSGRLQRDSTPSSLTNFCLCGAIDAYRKQVFRCVASVQFSQNESGSIQPQICILDKSHCYDAALWQRFPSAVVPEMTFKVGAAIPAAESAGEGATITLAEEVSNLSVLKLDSKLLGLGAGLQDERNFQDDVRSRWPLVVGGNALRKYPLMENLSERVIFSSDADIDATDVGRLAWSHFQNGVISDPLKLLPNYLRGSAAEEKKL